MSELKRIVLTGGPSGGKSTTLQRIQETRSDVFCAPEVATILLGGGFPAPTGEHGWTYEWQKSFQLAVAATQIALEQVCEIRALHEGKKIVVYDRGLVDGASYLRGGIAELADITGIEKSAMLARYDTVLHLPTGATRGPGAYDKHSNPHRFEEAEEALQLEHRVREAWQDHEQRYILDATSKSEVVSMALDAIA